MNTEKPSYYAVIPASVRYDKNLNANAKLLYGEITCLCNKEGYCWASNSYFASLYGVSSRSITNWLNSLEENGYITREVIYKDNSKEVESRIIRLNSVDVKKCSDPIEKNFTTPTEKNFTTPTEKNFTDNNININNIKINTKNNKKENKKEKILDGILAKFELYDFNEKVQERILDFYSDKIDSKEIPRENQLIATLDLLSSVPEKTQLEAINNSIRGGWKTIYLPNSNNNKQQSYVLNSDTESYQEQKQRVENLKHSDNTYSF